MKPKYCLIWILSLALVGCDGPTLPPSEALNRDHPSKDICREYTDESQGKCTANLRPISSNYVVKKKQVYWMHKSEYTDAPCLKSMAAYFHNLFSWRCWTSEPNHIDYIEERHLRRVAAYSPSFQPLEGSGPQLADWQQKQLADYAKDESAVYMGTSKIVGADPHDFSVIFPFGNDERWKDFSVARSGNTIFFGGRATDIDLNQFRAFSPVRCPEPWLPCPTNIDELLSNHDKSVGILGSIGSDVVLLQDMGVVRFANMVSPDMFMFITRYKIYLYTRGKFYEVNKGSSWPVDMDVNFYDGYSKY